MDKMTAVDPLLAKCDASGFIEVVGIMVEKGHALSYENDFTLPHGSVSKTTASPIPSPASQSFLLPYFRPPPHKSDYRLHFPLGSSAAALCGIRRIAHQFALV
jgi:hypothetical protein